MITRIRKSFVAISCVILMFVSGATTVMPQSRDYPKEIRGYKVERTVVEIKKPERKNQKSGNGPTRSDDQNDGAADSQADVDELIRFGQPHLTRVTPLGITFEVPIVVSPVKQ